MLGTVDITLRVMHHTECDVYDQTSHRELNRPGHWSAILVVGLECDPLAKRLLTMDQ
jgi:hypothetical protein